MALRHRLSAVLPFQVIEILYWINQVLFGLCCIYINMENERYLGQNELSQLQHPVRGVRFTGSLCTSLIYCNRGAIYAYERQYLNSRGTDQKFPLYSMGYHSLWLERERSDGFHGLKDCLPSVTSVFLKSQDVQKGTYFGANRPGP